MHPDIAIEIARQRAAELAEQAAAYRSAGRRRGPRPTLRTRLGWTLVRWGHRLAPPPAHVRRSRRRAATMGA